VYDFAMINRESSTETTSGIEVKTEAPETPFNKGHEGLVRTLSASVTPEADTHVRDGLSPEQVEQRVSEKLEAPEVQRALIQEFSPYSDEINQNIRTLPELEIYKSQSLQENDVNGRPCLKADKADINPRQTDAMGTTNAERMATGRAPVDENGDAFHLHHIGQKESSPLAELKAEVHQKHDSVLHEKNIPSEVHREGNNWDAERAAHWKARAQDFTN
jgi:hypothetical protein